MDRHEERLSVNAMPTGANAFNVLAGPSDPGMLERPRGNSTTKPLCGDVLRAYDSYRENLASAAGLPSDLAALSTQ